jgi:C4-dicarboxylate transporter DctQ subunit
MGIISGLLILIIGALSVMEGIVRSVFASPTSWSMDISLYMLIWAIFLGTSYSFQEKGHVAVDFIRERIGQVWDVKARKAMAVTGYLLALVYIVVLAGDSVLMIKDALELNKLTLANVQIPIVLLYAAMLVGSVMMFVTVICIISDLISGGQKYL